MLISFMVGGAPATQDPFLLPRRRLFILLVVDPRESLRR